MRYKLEDKAVGEGGFGRVFRAEDLALDRAVAIKELDQIWLKGTEADRERLRREAKILASLSHPNIPAIYDVEFGESGFRIIFQYIAGNTIRSLLKGGPLSIAEARVWFDQVASALAHAHETKLVHRDVKPENMIVSTDRKHCYLVDFGIALSQSELARLTESNQRLGTPGYMSPEQEKGQSLDSSDDLYVLAKCLYESLSGESISVGHYVELSVLNETVPAGIDVLIQRCLEPKPGRLGSAVEFRRALVSTLDVDRPFSEILTSGPLRELIGAVANFSYAEFMSLPAGQRRLVLSKCKDVLQSEDSQLEVARKEFLVAIIPHAVHATTADCAVVVNAGLAYGFARKVARWTGDRRIREAMELAAGVCGPDNHRVMVDALTAWIDEEKLDGKEEWYLHALRGLITHLMANTACADVSAEILEKHLDNVNEIQRDGSRQTSLALAETVEVIHRRARH